MIGDRHAGDQPELLADDREDVVGVRLGQLNLRVPPPGPIPSRPPAVSVRIAFSDWKLSPFAEQEAVDPHCATS
jgi:hypothetical protein